MCIVFWSTSVPEYSLVLAGNRDEYLGRATSDAGWHFFDTIVSRDPTKDYPPTPLSNVELRSDATMRSSKGMGNRRKVLSGRDLASDVGGTWLGLGVDEETGEIRIGAVTNIRQPVRPPPPNAPSRGLLLKNYLYPPQSTDSTAGNPTLSFLSTHKQTAESYDGFNLLLFTLRPTSSLLPPSDDHKGLWETHIGYLSNRPGPITKDLSNDQAKVRGMSNSPFLEPWPKVLQGQQMMESSLKEWLDAKGDDDDLIERMIDLLSQTTSLNCLVDTTETTRLRPLKVGRNIDEIPSESNPASSWYGTRVTTVILVKEDGNVIFVERDRAKLTRVDGGLEPVEIDGRGQNGENERRFEFKVVVTGKS